MPVAKATFLQPCVGIGRYPANQEKLGGRKSDLYCISDRRPRRSEPVGEILGRLSHTHARPSTSH